MQVSSSSKFVCYLHHKIWFVILSLLLLFSLIGCGGSPSSSLPLAQSQNPVAPPASPPSGSGTPTMSPPPPPPPPPPAGPPGVPPGAQIISAVQTLPDWQWCTAELHGHPCASGLGNATSSMTPDQQTPSLSGKSSVFTLGGRTHYSNALWWKSFGPNNQPTHFVYDVYFYIDHSNAPEALEFDVNQSMSGTRYTWGSECSYKNTGKWDVWNPETEAWVTTSVPCPTVEANKWHHLTWQIERVNGQVHYISVTVDNNVGKVDKYFNPQPHWPGNEVNVAFQMDGDYRQDPYSVWLDNVSLSAW